MNKLILLLITGLIHGQIIDPETGRTAELQYNPETGGYYFFGLDELNLLNGKSCKGKFIRKTNNLVYFKIEEKNGSILEVEMQNVSSLISENGNHIIDDLIIEKANKINHQKYLEKTATTNGKNENLVFYICAGPLGSMLLGGAVLLELVDHQSLNAFPIALISPIIPAYVINKIMGINYPESIQSNSDKKKYRKLYLKHKNRRIYKYILPSYFISYLAGGLFYMYTVSS